MIKKAKESLEAWRHPVRSPELKGHIKYFWTLRQLEPFSVNHVLIPVSNIDTIYNLGAPIFYLFPDRKMEICGTHVLGVRNTSVRVLQSAPIVMIGVSFDDFSALPFLKRPLRNLAHRIIDVERKEDALPPPIPPEMDAQHLLFESGVDFGECLSVLESAWLRRADFTLGPSEEELRILHAFREKEDDESILSFCQRADEHPKKLERMLYKYVGLPPKQYTEIRRAQRLHAEMIRGEGLELAHAAFDFGYFDQSHMNRSVRKLFSTSPARLQKGNVTAKSIIRTSDCDRM